MGDDLQETKYISVDAKENKISCLWKFGFLFSFFLLGLINNLGYVLILTGASQLSKKFDNDNLNALYLLSLIMCSSLAKLINSKYLITVSYKIRIFFISIYFFIGYISLYFILNSVEGDSSHETNKTEAFFLSLIPSFIMGTGSAFGEATILGYLRNFPKDFVSGWSSGTGLAGVIGAVITLTFHIMDIKPRTMYLVISPVCIIYFFSFFFVERLYNKYLSNIKTSLLDSEINKDFEAPQELSVDVSQNKNFSIKNFITGFKKSMRYILNLAAVYYLEYTINSGFGERVATKGYITDSDKDFQYEYFSLCYQIGVFISRSSLPLIKHIKFVEIFTIIQFVNFVMWFVNVYTGFESYSAVAFGHFIIIGLMGGSSYVGCYYFLLNSEEIETDIKELCVNIASMMNDCGVLLASLSVLLFDNTIMKI